MPALIANEHATTVERIFSAYAQPEASLGSVARTLGEAGISAPRRETWDNVALSRLLHSPLYVMADEEIYLYYAAKGLHMANPPEDFDGLHAAMLIGKRDRSAGKYQDLKEQHISLCNHFGLVSSSLWLQCQYKLERNRQFGGQGRGKHSWLSGLMKCAHCSYSVKINRDGEKYYLVCSGRSNLKLCDASIRIDLRELEAAVALELETMLAQCPDVEAEATAHQGQIKALEEIERKIDRLMDALAQSTDMSMMYINRTIERLETERQALLDEQGKQHVNPRPDIRRLRLEALDFEEKKLVAGQFIKEIRLDGNSAQVVWTV